MTARNLRVTAFSITESIMVALALMIVIAIIAKYVTRSSIIIQQRAAASHLMQISKAANEYLLMNRDSLIGLVDSTSGPIVTVQDLIDSECLPEGFGTQNVWAQDYQIHIRAPRPDELMAVTLTTGGTEGEEKFAATIAS